MARITRAKSAIHLDKGDLAQLEKELFEALNTITKVSERREVVKPAGDILQAAARAITPVSEKPHYTYNTPKIFSGLRAPNGSGVRAGTYWPGNLRNSIVDIAERRKKIGRKTWRVIIGPFYRGRRKLKSGQYGKTEKGADGYYAHMVFGSSRAFRSNVTGRALASSKGAIMQSIRFNLVKYFRQATQKTQYIK